jgi:phage-related protein
MEDTKLMNFLINGLDMGESTDFDIESPVAGLDSPPIRTSTINYSGRDGGVVTGQNYSARQITIQGFFHGNCNFVGSRRVRLIDYFPIRTDLDFFVTMFDGTEYYSSVRCLDIKMDITDAKVTRFKIELLAGDPVFYNSGESRSQIIPKEVGGGFILPVILPIVFSAGSGATIINNNGNVDTYPTFTIVGSAHNPTITKVDTGEKVEVDITMTGTDTLFIDMKNRVITLNGGSVLGYRTTDSDWFTLDQGNNDFIYETTSGGDTGVCTITWLTGVLGI